MPACGFPWLFAAYRVLLRLLAPRHPPYALISLTISLKLSASQYVVGCARQFRSHILICSLIASLAALSCSHLISNLCHNLLRNSSLASLSSSIAYTNMRTRQQTSPPALTRISFQIWFLAFRYSCFRNFSVVLKILNPIARSCFINSTINSVKLIVTLFSVQFSKNSFFRKIYFVIVRWLRSLARLHI